MNKVKLAALTVAIALTLLTTASVTASTGEKSIGVTYRDIALYVDGTLVSPAEDDGTPIEPFIYGGRVFLPVRAVGEALGCGVLWSDMHNSIYVESKSARTVRLEGNTIIRDLPITIGYAEQNIDLPETPSTGVKWQLSDIDCPTDELAFRSDSYTEDATIHRFVFDVSRTALPGLECSITFEQVLGDRKLGNKMVFNVTLESQHVY